MWENKDFTTLQNCLSLHFVTFRSDDRIINRPVTTKTVKHKLKLTNTMFMTMQELISTVCTVTTCWLGKVQENVYEGKRKIENYKQKMAASFDKGMQFLIILSYC